jgi:hypothetical protein
MHTPRRQRPPCNWNASRHSIDDSPVKVPVSPLKRKQMRSMVEDDAGSSHSQSGITRGTWCDCSRTLVCVVQLSYMKLHHFIRSIM